jgi:hypothetical protein
MDREEAVIARREGRRYSTEDREADEFIAALNQEQGR